MGLAGDQLYLYGFRHDDFRALDLAAHIFPYERQVMAGPAHFAMRRGIPDQSAWTVLTDALSRDPWAIDIRVARRQIELAARGSDRGVEF